MIKPQLADQYIAATREVFKIRPYVDEPCYGKFLVVEDDLRSIHAEPRDYAFTVIRMLKSWALDKHLRCVTVSVFCGPWAYKRFLKVHKSQSVEMTETSGSELLHSELTVARYYIEQHMDGNAIRFVEAVDDLKPLLSKDWIKEYTTTKRIVLISQATDELCESYGIKFANNYSQIIEALWKKRTTTLKDHSG